MMWPIPTNILTNHHIHFLMQDFSAISGSADAAAFPPNYLKLSDCFSRVSSRDFTNRRFLGFLRNETLSDVDAVEGVVDAKDS